MSGNNDIKFMSRCLELAVKAEGMTYPNPLVGAVIVYNGEIIGEGYHLEAGSAHAEVLALESVKDRALLRSSTLYVNLEPCSHFGKTPPCADMIISCGIRKVVIGTADTSEKVSGRGANKIRNAGIEVISGVAEQECRRINRRFFSFHERKRPFIILKWAQSADGYIDKVRAEGGSAGPNWITGRSERTLVHKWRAEEQAILVGAGTVRADNPKLNVREWKGNDPLRIILNGSGILPIDPAVFKSPGTNIIFTHYPANEKKHNTLTVKLDRDISAAAFVSDYLFSIGIQSLLIEGGAKVIGHFIGEGYWDEARIFTGKKYFKDGVRAPEIEGKLLSEISFAESTLEIIGPAIR